jgi:hypothetical protein
MQLINDVNRACLLLNGFGKLNISGPRKQGPVNEKVEKFRQRPRKRPDWGALMKDLESKEIKEKLRKVATNDRSAPLLPRMKSRGQV